MEFKHHPASVSGQLFLTVGRKTGTRQVVPKLISSVNSTTSPNA